MLCLDLRASCPPVPKLQRPADVSLRQRAADVPLLRLLAARVPPSVRAVPASDTASWHRHPAGGAGAAGRLLAGHPSSAHGRRHRQQRPTPMKRSSAAFQEEKIPVLIGTQMVAKGLDFPNVTLVGVHGRRQSPVSGRRLPRGGDDVLHASPRWSAARAAAIGQGRAMIQTMTPDHHRPAAGGAAGLRRLL